MSVRELVELLQQLPQDEEVVMYENFEGAHFRVQSVNVSNDVYLDGHEVVQITID